jgi:serine/threonine protein kinase
MAARRSPPPQAGTLSYQAPEIFGDGDDDGNGDGDGGVGDSSFPVDVFAFGVILWELGTRQIPWRGVLPVNKVRGAGAVRRSEHPPQPSD